MTEWQVTGLIVGGLILIWSIAALAFRRRPSYSIATAYFTVSFSDPEISEEEVMDYLMGVVDGMSKFVEALPTGDSEK